MNADVRLSPADAADDAEWLTVTAWQGDGLVVDRLRRVGPGHYRTTEPIPVNGNWKSLIRLHNGNSLTAVPVFLPRDQAIPAKEVPARARASRARSWPTTRSSSASRRPPPPALTVAAYLVVVAIALALLALLVWGLHRLAGGRARGHAAARAPRGRAAHAGAGGHPCLTWPSRWRTTRRYRPCPSSGRCC